MKINIVFLITGLILSVISKVYQFKIKEQAHVGNGIVIPAGVCFCLAILFSLKKYNALFSNADTQLKAIIIAVCACTVVVSFRIMMMSFVTQKVLYGGDICGMFFNFSGAVFILLAVKETLCFTSL